jgi:hypothetical protein
MLNLRLESLQTTVRQCPLIDLEDAKISDGQMLASHLVSSSQVFLYDQQ